MHIYHNIPLQGADSRPFLLDAYQPSSSPRAVALFVHGFKGFKDWGHWDLIARTFVDTGIAFVKFNLSHNGTTLDAPSEFGDLEAFGQNNYTKERYDIQQAIDWTRHHYPNIPLFMIGHSRGGAISIVETAQRKDVAGLITWASVSSLAYAWQTPGFMDQWAQKGVYYVLNGRTGQEMPLYYQLFEDYEAHLSAFDVAQAVGQLPCPLLILHGDSDPGVPEKAAHQLKGWAGPNGYLHIIAGADHVFGGQHPYRKTELPVHSKELVDQTIRFISSILG